MKYKVIFSQYHDYIVEASNVDDAYESAYSLFHTDMRSAIANTAYDEVSVFEQEEE